MRDNPVLKKQIDAVLSAAAKAPVALNGLTAPARAFVAAQLAQSQTVLFVTPSVSTADRAAEDLKAFTGGRVSVYRPREVGFIGALTGREPAWQRLKALMDVKQGEARVLVLPAEALLAVQMPPARFFGLSQTLTLGQRIDPDQLTNTLSQMGYERVQMVEVRGQFARRGEIVDIFSPSDDEPLRLSFFDTDIDQLRRFDPVTQRGGEMLTTCVIGPAEEYLLDAADAAKAAQGLKAALSDAAHGLTARFARDLADLEAGERPEDVAALAPLVWDDRPNLFDYFPNALIVLDQPDRVGQRLNDRFQGFVEDFSQAFQRQEALPFQQDRLLSTDEVIARLKKRAVVTVQELLLGQMTLSPKEVIALEAESLLRFHNKLPDLANAIKDWLNEGLHCQLMTGGRGRGERMKEGLSGQGVPLAQDDRPGLDVRPLTLSRGFVLRALGVAFISDNDLYGDRQQKPQAKKRAGEGLTALSDLKVGDYVVHDHHGIGQFTGTVRLQSEGAWRDYLLIQYRGTDKLYIPTEQFDKVSRYIGGKGEAPALNSLAGGEWQKQKRKVRQGLQKLAFDLVKLYAKRQSTPGTAFLPQEPFESQFADGFDHELTPDQARAVDEVMADMAGGHNMDRLLCGDVGYGKTEVAMRAAFRAASNGKQVAVLAPTTVLVQQHVNTFVRRFRPFPITVDYVSRFRSAQQNKQVLQRAAAGEVDILIGTHRLLSQDVSFKHLGLLVVDEEQRFGVGHKERIKTMKSQVDVLTLSATPIPRTLHMSMVGVRDLSIIQTPPSMRNPVNSYVIEYADSLVRDAIMREMARHGQCFFLYNQVETIERMAQRLRQLVPEARVAVAHGQMPERQLEDVMMDFTGYRYDVLLCSTIIENGLDIPRANTLIVYDADRFGLSQLYQLRGRVGRSRRSAYAYFTLKPDKQISEAAEKRLTAIREFTQFGAGFAIALRDLEIRGAGNLFGPEQSGQVAEVGYELYTRMIEEAVLEAKGEMDPLQQDRPDSRVELAVNAYLPEGYVAGEKQRLSVYRAIAAIKSDADAQQMTDDLVDRFGEPPLAVITLIKVALLRALATRLGVDILRREGQEIVMRISAAHAPDPAKLYEALMALHPLFSLSQGKRTSLVMALKARTDEDALAEAIEKLGILVEKVAGETGT